MASLTYVRRIKTVVETERHIAAHRITHLIGETGLARFDTCPIGGGKAGDGDGDDISIFEEGSRLNLLCVSLYMQRKRLPFRKNC